MDRILAQHAGVLEDDRSDRCLAAPVGELLIAPSGRAKGIEGGGPARIGLRPAVKRRE